MGDLKNLLHTVDAVKFARERLGFHPDARQAEVLGRRWRRALLNCTRQGSESTVRGFSAVSLMIIDEAARVSDDLYKTLRPMTAVSGGDMLLMSTPSGQRGFFYEAWINRTEEWERVSVPATECTRIPEAF